MVKKVLIISSSLRKGGNSDTLADEFMRGAKESGNSVEKISLRKKKINYCTGVGSAILENRVHKKMMWLKSLKKWSMLTLLY